MLISANFGSTRTGLETVGYKILNADKTEYAGRTTTGVTELGGGVYGVQVADADLTGRYVVWDSGEASPVYAAEGFGMTLADDAITAATFDEATAFPLTAADTGATILARAGAKMDLVDAPNATALGAIKDAVQGAGTTLATLLSRIIGTLATGTHNPQTGDAYARLGAAGAGLTALGDARLANLDAAVSGREASGAAAAAVVGLSTFNPATDEVDVGKVKGVGVTDIDDFKADVSGLSTLTAGDLPSEPPSAGTIADAVWDEAAADHVSAGTFGKLMLAFKTLLGHKSIENSESTSVTFRTAGDAGDAGTQSWDEDNKTRGEYTGF